MVQSVDASPKHARCLCGSVRITITGPLAAPMLCHCVQCRRQTTHVFGFTSALQADTDVKGAESIRWFQSSANGHRGFCDTCGSVLFFRFDGDDQLYISSGAFERGALAPVHGPLFVSEKGDYYEIEGALPKYLRGI